MTSPSTLPNYGGREVVRTGISIRNAGDGLSEALGIEPQVLPLGSVQYVVLECVVHAHDHDRIMDKGTDTGLLVLDQVFKAGTATLIDGDVVRTAIAEQAEKIKLAREAAEGTQRLPFDDELDNQHAAGGHKGGLIAGCSACDAEARAIEKENGEPTPIGKAKSAAKKKS